MSLTSLHNPPVPLATRNLHQSFVIFFLSDHHRHQTSTAMGELAGGAVLGAFLQVLFDRLATPAIAGFKQVYGIEKDLDRLQDTVDAIRALLRDADSRKKRDAAVDLWLSKLKAAAYDAEDLLDEFHYEMLRHQVEDGGCAAGLEEEEEEEGGRQRLRKRDKVKNALSSITKPRHLRFRHRLSQEIRRICERLEDIKNDSRFKLDPLVVVEVDRWPLSSRGSRETSSFSSDPHLFGRESERDKIINLFLGLEDDAGGLHPSVLPVIGIPGIGKTTLAQIVYNDRRVKDHFNLMMWVCVGNDFDVTKLTEKIFEYVASSEEKFCGFGNLNIVQEKLGKKLEGKRFLLVLDDVWNDNRDEWQKLHAPLAYGDKGSMILATTRNKSVAKAMGTLKPIHLEGLSFEDCLSLIRKYAPIHGDPQSNQILEEICSKIVDKLTGVPLAVKTIGSFLSSKAEEGRWRDVLEMEIWELPQRDDDILPVSRLSYEQLPLHLKACFAYCSLFPKNHEFVKSDLVKLWMANGYIQTKKGERVEDVGSDYFDELYNRSFFVKIDDRYFMPGVCHELAQSVSSHDCARVERGNWSKALEKECCHLSFSSNNIGNLSKLTELRSLLHTCHYDSTYFVLKEDLLCRLSHLRVLNLSGSHLFHLPKSIGDLKHLHFLDLSFTKIAELPESISKLYNLLSLQLNKCSNLHEIHNGVTNLINLRHLSASGQLLSGLSRIGKLICLQELEQFSISREDGHKIRELRNMKDLRGRLCILNLQNVESEEETTQAKLKGKKHLDELGLEWSGYCSSDAKERKMELEGKVLEVLQPPISLKILSIKGNEGLQFPSWMNNHFVNNLKSISLRYIRNWNILPTLGNLQFLQSLKIEYLLAVEKVGPEFYGGDVFPSLEVLKFRHMHQWQDWLTMSEVHAFPKLQEFLIEDCPKLKKIISPKSLKSLKIEKCPMLLKDNNFTLLQGLHSPLSLLCSLENSYPNLESCVDDAMQHLTTLEGLEICYYDEDMSENKWSMRPSWMPFSFSQGRAADEIQLMNHTFSIHDGSDTRIFLLYTHNYPDYLDRYRRDVCICIRNCRDDYHGYQSLSTCLEDNLTSLQRLSVKGCQNIACLLKGSVFLSLTKLEQLEIDDCRNLVVLELFPQQHETVSLKVLIIGKCPDLVSFPRLKLTALAELQVRYCEKLDFMDLQELVSLKRLEIVECPRLSSRIFTHRLTNLLELRIIKCPQVFSFSRETEACLENLSSLQLLEIRNCINIKQLPTNLQELFSLRCLSIMHCPEIWSLPKAGLPLSLEELCIEGCPLLQERCQKGGPDWPMIADIPKRTISCAKCYPWSCRCSHH